MLIQPLSVWLSLCIMFFQLVIRQNFVSYCIHHQHFPRMDSSFFQNLLFRDSLKYSDFRCQIKMMIFRNIISGWTKSVSVQNSSKYIPVTEQYGCRTVPWLHHCCVILIKIFFCLAESIIVCPWFWNDRHDSKRQIHSIHYKKFQCIV